LNLTQLIYPESGKYQSFKEGFEPIDFFLDVLPVATQFDLLLGYFSSSSLRVLSEGFALFLYGGGRMRMITNHFYNATDKDALLRGESRDSSSLEFSTRNITQIREALGSYGTHFFNCLAWLIAKDRIQLVVIRPKSGRGISHYKSGLLADGNHKVAFTGSCNFTYSGLVENQESLIINKSFDSQQSVKAIEEFETDFELLFTGQQPDQVEYLELSSIQEVITEHFGGRTIAELLEDEKDLFSKIKPEAARRIRAKKQRLNQLIEKILREPKFPFETPRDYQVQAYQAWVSNNRQGIFAMATGTGKTLTALNCLLEEYRQTDSYRALVLVPTIALVGQWEGECRRFNFEHTVAVSSKTNWKKDLSFLSTINLYKESSFIIIATYASFVSKSFQLHLSQLPKDMLLIADEAHNVGAPTVLKKIEGIHLARRIGLSATIERKYDDFGSQGIATFFNDQPPYCFEYSMDRAINGQPKVLCSYLYFPVVVKLTTHELEKYTLISRQLAKFIDGNTGKYRDGKEVEMLLLKRKRIIHKAENKAAAFREILEEEFRTRGDLNYTLVYVPEGNEANYLESDDPYQESLEERNLIDAYTQIVMEVDDSIIVQQYTAKTRNRDAVLEQFAEGQVNVLCSMKCLDEGVDVPRAELAIFCASTGNPRQFIQRRGRILRQHPNKTLARIYDLVVVPLTSNDETFRMERSLVAAELERVKHFSRLAVNKIQSFERLKPVLKYYDLTLNTPQP